MTGNVPLHTSAHGYTLVELMVGMTVGALLLVALLSFVASAGNALRTRDTVADLQERARYALAAIEPELQMAGYFGLTTRGADFGLLSGGDTAAALPPAALRQSVSRVALIPASAHACGDNFVLDLSKPIQADNNGFQLGRNRSSNCDPRAAAVAGTDTLTIRRASSATVAAESGRLQLLVNGIDNLQRWLLSDGVLPPGMVPGPDQLQLHNLETHIYYIATDSDGQPGVPALRVKSLTRVAGRPSFVDTEVIGGVEDLQLQFQTATGYYDPGAVPANTRVLATRLWLRLRASSAEGGYVDARDYRYAGARAVLDDAARHYRRLLVNRTIALRNALAN